MGFISRSGKIAGEVVNVRVHKWFALDYIKESGFALGNFARSLFTINQADRTETFEEALERLDLKEEDISDRQNEFMRLMIIYLVISACIFGYSVFIAYNYKNLLGFFMGLGITIFSLSHAFKYHFWIFQLKNRKLGCSLKDWFLDEK